MCSGIIHVGNEWTTIAGKVYFDADYNAEACKFQTKSAKGQRILKICPDGSRCEIDYADGTGGDEYGNGITLGTILGVRRK